MPLQEDLSRLRIDRAAAPAPRRRGRLGWAAAGLAVIALAGYAGYAKFGAAQAVETATVVTAYPSQAFTLLNATGYVVAQRKAAVASKATGRLEWLGVLEGSRVKKGEVMARVENRDMTAALEQAAANANVARANLEQGFAELADAEASFKRSEDMLAQKYISPAAHDAVLSRYRKAKAAITGLRAAIAAAEANQRSAQVALEQTLIRAPFDGVVLTKNANVGDLVTPFSAALDTKGVVVTMADMETLEVEADVSESNLSKVSVDQPCEVTLEAFQDLRLACAVSRMVPTMDRSKATLLVKVRFVDRDPRVLPDMSAKVAFLSRAVSPEERKPVTAVQPAAIATRAGRSTVFVVNQGTVREVAVETGAKINELTEVRGKLKAGDKAVLNPLPSLHDGASVRVAAK